MKKIIFIVIVFISILVYNKSYCKTPVPVKYGYNNWIRDCHYSGGYTSIPNSTYYYNLNSFGYRNNFGRSNFGRRINHGRCYR